MARPVRASYGRNTRPSRQHELATYFVLTSKNSFPKYANDVWESMPVTVGPRASSQSLKKWALIHESSQDALGITHIAKKGRD